MIVRVRPLTVGRFARLSEVFTVGWSPVPNQYSGRYIRYWKSNRLTLLTLALLMYGKMYVGGYCGASAMTAVPPVIGVLCADVELLLVLLLQPAAASASAARPAASIRRRDRVRDTPDFMT